jgi:hypothetical protein
MEAGHVAKAVSGDVQLSAIDLSQLAGLNAIPLYQAFLSGDVATALDPTTGLSWLNAIPSYLQLLGGDPSGLTNVAAFSAIPSFLSGDFTSQAAFDAIPSFLAGDFTSQDAFNAIPIYQQLAGGDTTNLGDLSSVNALVAFSQVPSEGLHAFVPVEDADGNTTAHPGYAALSGLYNYQQFLTTGDITSNGLGGIDAFSALAAITPPAASAATPAAVQQEAPPSATQTPLLKTAGAPALETKTVQTPKISNPITTALANVTPPSLNIGKTDVPKQQPAASEPASLPTLKEKSSVSTGKPSNGSYSGSFKPNNPVVLFGSGGGNGSADNGIRGWGKVVSGIKGALGGSSSSSSGSGG